MDQASKSQVLPCSNCPAQGFKRQLRVNAPAQSPANAFSAEQIKNDGKIHKLSWQMNVRDVCYPNVVEPCYRHIFDKIRIHSQAMVRIGCDWLKPLFPAAEELLLAHKANESL